MFRQKQGSVWSGLISDRFFLDVFFFWNEFDIEWLSGGHRVDDTVDISLYLVERIETGQARIGDNGSFDYREWESMYEASKKES